MEMRNKLKKYASKHNKKYFSAHTKKRNNQNRTAFTILTIFLKLLTPY
jgi:hypothetical protein